MTLINEEECNDDEASEQYETISQSKMPGLKSMTKSQGLSPDLRSSTLPSQNQTEGSIAKESNALNKLDNNRDSPGRPVSPYASIKISQKSRDRSPADQSFNITIS